MFHIRQIEYLLLFAFESRFKGALDRFFVSFKIKQNAHFLDFE